MTNLWVQHVKAYHHSHPHIPYGKCMSLARATYGRNRKKQPAAQNTRNKFDGPDWAEHSSGLFMDNGLMTITGTSDKKYKQAMNKVKTLLQSKRWSQGRFAWVEALSSNGDGWRVEHNAGILLGPSKWVIYHPDGHETLSVAGAQTTTMIMSSLKEFLTKHKGPFDIRIQH